MSEACCEFQISGIWVCEDREPCDCYENQGTPLGPGTECDGLRRGSDPGWPGCGTQACCVTQGGFRDCFEASTSDCIGLGGSPAGRGSSCERFDGNYSCDAPDACCRFTMDGRPSCTQVGGAGACFGGVGVPDTACAAANCEQLLNITEACCQMSGLCSDQSFRSCCADGGMALGFRTTCAEDESACVPFDPPGCRERREDRRATHMIHGQPFRGTTADLCAHSFSLPITLAVQRGPQPVTVHPVRMTALSIQDADAQHEECHLHVGEFVDLGGRFGLMVCGMRVFDGSVNNPHRFKALGGVVMVDNDDFKGHALVAVHETPMWQEAQFHSILWTCQGDPR